MYFISILVLASLGTVCCLEIIPERCNLTYLNEKYIESGHANIRRCGRFRRYCINLYLNIKHTWANNVTIHLISTEYLHNEYRRSFIEFHYKFCDFINKEPYIGGMLKKVGLVCPLPKGKHAFVNMTAQTENFPNVFPFEKGGAEVEVNADTGEKMLLGYINVTFKQKRKH